MQPRWIRPVLAGTLFLALAAPIHAESFPTVASGEGASRESALASALRHAVEQAVGLNVSTNQQVQNLKNIQDRIYSTAEGFIEGYEVVDEVRVPGGGYRVTVQAKVSKEKLCTAVEPITGSAIAFDGKLAMANFENDRSNEEALKETLKLWLEEAAQKAIKYTFDTSIEPIEGDSEHVNLVLKNIKMSIDNDWVNTRYRPFHDRLTKQAPGILRGFFSRLHAGYGGAAEDGMTDVDFKFYLDEYTPPVVRTEHMRFGVLETLVQKELPAVIPDEGFNESWEQYRLSLERSLTSRIKRIELSPRWKERLSR